MKKCKITITDEVWCNISGLQPSEHEFLWNKLAPFVDGYFWNPKYKLGKWDGKIRFYQKTGKTYVRLLDKVIPLLDGWGYDFELVDNRNKFDNFPIECHEDLFSNIEIGGKPFKIRSYQVDAVKALINEGSGFCVAGTGSGKTTITAALSHCYSSVGYKVITIVPSSDLVTQTADWYEMLQLDTGVYSGSEKRINHKNVVATWQSIQYNPSVMSEFDVLIWDECHGISASVAQKLINDHGKHIAFRFGVTGTFPKSESDRMSLHASIGSILKEIPASWLIENGYLSKLEILPVELNETYVEEQFPDYTAEKSFLSKSTSRMEKIADIIISQCSNYGNTLVLVNSIPFGEKLSSLIKDSVFLYGESPKDLRKEHYEMFDSKDDIIVIASTGIASTGISIDRVFCLIMVDAGKSFIKAIQSIGRGLRKGYDKDYVHVVDIHSKLKWAKKHFKERHKYYTEAGYPVLKKESIKVTK